MQDSLIIRDRIGAELMEIKTIEQAITYLNKLKSIEVWIKKEQKDAELQNVVAEQKIRVQSIIGRMIEDGQKSGEIKIAGSNQHDVGGDIKSLPQLGLTKKQSSRFQLLGKVPDEERESAFEEIKAHGDEVTQLATIRLTVGKKKTRENDALRTAKAQSATGKYQVINIDSPWEMQKIDRDKSPEETSFDYPTMNYDQLAMLEIPSFDDCHLFSWTTHKHLPAALELVKKWGFKYVLTMNWHKNGGFQPFGLPQYNNEFCIYARKGTPKFSTTKSFFTSFEGKRREHSRKPDEFYDMITRVTEGQTRIDMFSREKREGWAQFGNEINKLTNV